METEPEDKGFFVPAKLQNIETGQNLYFQIDSRNWGFWTKMIDQAEYRYQAKGIIDNCPYIIELNENGQLIDSWCQRRNSSRDLTDQEIQEIIENYSKAEIIEQSKII